MSGVTVRRGTAAEVGLVCEQRSAMFRDMGFGTSESREKMSARFAPWAIERFASGEFLQWFAEADGAIVGGASVWLKPVHPGLRSPENVVVYVLNVFVEPEHRSRGVARALMVAITEWARAADHHVIELHASDQGRPLYESLGFAATNEMRFLLR